MTELQFAGTVTVYGPPAVLYVFGDAEQPAIVVVVVPAVVVVVVVVVVDSDVPTVGTVGIDDVVVPVEGAATNCIVMLLLRLAYFAVTSTLPIVVPHT